MRFSVISVVVEDSGRSFSMKNFVNTGKSPSIMSIRFDSVFTYSRSINVCAPVVVAKLL